jgi:hypothetical protein
VSLSLVRPAPTAAELVEEGKRAYAAGLFPRTALTCRFQPNSGPLSRRVGPTIVPTLLAASLLIRVASFPKPKSLLSPNIEPASSL